MSKRRKKMETNEPGLFSKGQKVLCFDRGEPYEARIEDINLRNSERRYKIHYMGWNPRYDEWVAQERIIIDSEKNRKTTNTDKIEQKTPTPVEKDPKGAKRSTKKKVTPRSTSKETVLVSGAKRSSEQQNLVLLRSSPQVPQQPPPPQELEISTELLQILKEDKDWVVNMKQVPYFGQKKWTVETVLDAWANDIQRNTSASRTDAQTLFVQAFNQICFGQLLYPSEREHFLALSGPFKKEPSRCCGVVFLVRLLYFFLTNAHKVEKCEDAEEMLMDLMDFLQTNSFRFGIQIRNGHP